MLHWQCRRYEIDRDDSFELLCELGSELPGAVYLLEENRIEGAVSARQPDPVVRSSDVSTRGPKFSLAATQWKLAAKISDNPFGNGFTIAADRQGQPVIAKFDSPGYDAVPQNEAATMKWASVFGLEVPQCGLHSSEQFDFLPDEIPLGDGNVFVIERFDRMDQSRIHIEDFAQILDRPISMIYDGDYEEIARVLAVVSPQSVVSFVRQVIFSVCCGNGDAHLKNFSLLYENSRLPRLSPVYDQLSTIVHGDKGLALRLGGEKHWNIHPDRFEELIRIAGRVSSLPDDWLQQNVNLAMKAYGSIKDQYPARHRAQLTAHFKRLLLLFNSL